MSVQLIDPNAKPVHERKDRSVGAIASFVIHGLIILLLLFMAFPFDGGGGGTGGEGEGIPVDFGTAEFGSGAIAPTAIDPSQSPTPEEMSAPPVTPVDQSQNDVVTADDPESFAIKDKKETKKPVENQPVKETTKPVTETPKTPVKEQPKVNQEALFGGSKGTTNTTGSQGDDAPGTKGDKGETHGTTGSTYKGPGGTGSPGSGGGTGGGDGTGDGPGTGPGSGPGSGGIDFQLKNRRVTYKPVVTGKIQEAGKIVISITVNRQGIVVDADCCAAKGSTLSHNALAVQTALNEAKKMKFNADAAAATEQYGTVTFTFVPK